jgi:ribosomal protein S12 methylthiotransferase
VGFPGETEEEFEDLLQFLRDAGIDRAGCFAYSEIDGAVANDLPNLIPEDVKQARRARFMQVAQEVATERLARRQGAVIQVLVDKAIAMGKKGGVGRSYADAPEIDGVVHLLPPEKISKTYKVGDFIKARVVEVRGHDLIALPI